MVIRWLHGVLTDDCEYDVTAVLDTGTGINVFLVVDVGLGLMDLYTGLVHLIRGSSFRGKFSVGLCVPVTSKQ